MSKEAKFLDVPKTSQRSRNPQVYLRQGKGEKRDLNTFMRPLSCIADALCRSSSSGKYFHVFWGWETSIFYWKTTSHFIVFSWTNFLFSLIITFYGSPVCSWESSASFLVGCIFMSLKFFQFLFPFLRSHNFFIFLLTLTIACSSCSIRFKNR